MKQMNVGQRVLVRTQPGNLSVVREGVVLASSETRSAVFVVLADPEPPGRLGGGWYWEYQVEALL